MVNNFLEYLNSKKNIEKPKVKVVADEVDVPKDKAKKPPKAPGMIGGMQPYVKEGKAPKKAEKGFGDIEGAPNVHYDVTKSKKPAKLAIAESCFNIVPVLRESAKQDSRTIELLVSEFKKHKLLGALVGELLTHKETYREMAEVMGSKNYGQEICNRLAKAIREVSEPFHDDLSGDGGPDADLNSVPEDDSEMNPEDHIFGDGDEDGEEIDPNELPEDELGEMPPEGEEGPPPVDADGNPIDPSAVDADGNPIDPNAVDADGNPIDPNGNPIMPQGHIGQDVPPALEHLRHAFRGILG